MNKILLLCFLFLCVFRVEAADYYWVGGAGSWTDLNHWSTTSGGAPNHSIIPNLNDDVYFDVNSGLLIGNNIDLPTTSPAYCRNMSWAGVTVGARLIHRGQPLYVYGSVELSAQVLYGTQGITFVGSTPATLRMNGAGRYPVAGWYNPITVNKPGSSLTLLDGIPEALAVTTVTLTAGSLDMSDFTHYFQNFSGNNTAVRSLDISNTILNLNGTWDYRGTNNTINTANSYISTLIFHSDRFTFPKVDVNAISSWGMEINNTTFGELTFTSTTAAAITSRIGANNTVDRLEFKGGGTLAGSGNVIKDLYIAPSNPGFVFVGNNTITGSLHANTPDCDALSQISGASTIPSGTGTGTITFGPGATTDVRNVYMANLNATGGVALPITVTGADGGGNTGWDFQPRATGTTLYWVGGAGDWNDKNHWAASTGGVGGHCVPFTGDDVVFDGNSGFTAGNNTVTATAGTTWCRNMTWTNLTGAPVFDNLGQILQVYGSMELDPTLTLQGAISFKGTEASTLTSNGFNLGTVNFRIERTGTDGGITLMDDIAHPTLGIFHNSGKLLMVNRTLHIYRFSLEYNGVRTLDISNSTITLEYEWQTNASNNTWLNNGAGSFIIAKNRFLTNGLSYPNVQCGATGGNVDIRNAEIDELLFTNTGLTFGMIAIGGGNTIGTVEFNGAAEIRGNNTINNLILAPSRNYSIRNTQTINGLFSYNNPDCSGLGELRGVVGTSATLNFGPASTKDIQNVLLQNMTASGTGVPVAVTGADAGGNTGFNFTASSGGPRYWVGGSGDWNDAAHWSATSGGPGGACVPTVSNDVFFDANSFTSGSSTVTAAQGHTYCRNMDWTGATFAPTFTKDGAFNLEIWGSLVMNPAVRMNTPTASGGRPAMLFTGPTNSIITSNGSELGDFDFSIDKPNGSAVTLTDDFNNANTSIEVRSGSLDLSGRTITARGISDINTTNPTDINITNAVISSGWHFMGTGTTVEATGSTITATNFRANKGTYNNVEVTSTDNNSIDVSNITINNLLFSNPHTASQAWIRSNNTINKLEFKGRGYIQASGNVIDTLIFAPGKTYTFEAGTNTTINEAWYGSGTPCNPTQIVSSSTTANATVTKTAGTVDFDYIRLNRITAAGVTPFKAREHSVDLGGNLNWDISPFDNSATITGLGPDIHLGERDFPYTLDSDGFFGNPESQYEWSRDGTVIGTADTQEVTEPGIYAVSVTFSDGCSVSDEITIFSQEADVETVKTTKEPGKTNYVPGEDVVYTITVTNNGPYAALDVRIEDPTPEGASITAWTAMVEAGDVDLPNGSGAGNLDETIEELPNGAVVVYEITLSTGSGMETDLVNTVAVTSITPDPESGCETCAVTLSASPVADLSVTKTLKDGSQIGYVPGDAVEYIILVSNEGPSDARNISIQDTAPEGTIITSWTATVVDGVVDVPNGNGSGDLDETLAILPEGAVIRYEITVQTPIDFKDNLINMSEVTSDTEDPNDVNNRAITPGLPSVPDAPVSGGDQEGCAENPVQTFTATANVPTGVSIVWYDAITGGNLVADPSLGSVGTVTYYAEAVKDGLSSQTRTAVNLTILPLPTVVINDPGVVCLPDTVDLTATEVTVGSDVGLVFTYYTDAAGTIELANPGTIGLSGTYYIAGTYPDTGCRTVMPVTVRFVDRPEVSVVHPSCVEGTGFIEVTHPIGVGFEYSINGVDYQVGTEFSGLPPGTTYEVTSRHTDLVGCVSEPLEVMISSNPVTETPMVIQPDCEVTLGSIRFQEDPEYEYSIDNGANYQVSPNFTNLVGGTYMARIRRPSTACEAEAVAVTVNGEIVLPDAPIGDGDQEACSTDPSLPLVATASVPEGVTVIWYDTPSGGNIVDNPIWAQVGSMTYYAEAYDGTCVSPERTSVTLTIKVAPVPDPLENVTVCEAYTLPAITGSDLSGNEAYYTGPGGTGDRYQTGETITDPGNRILFIYDVSDNGCEGETSFELNINEVHPGNIGLDQTIRLNEVPEPIRSEEDGTGMGSIEYRWEISADGLSWSLVVGANGATYQPGALVTTSHYRRITLATMPGGTICESGPTDEVTITVMEIDGPLANDDMVSTPTHTPITFNPLANDVEGDFPIDPTSVKFIDPGTGEEVVFLDIMGEGTWSVDPDTGEVTFAPDAGFNGETTPIGYVMYDEAGMESNPALLMVRIMIVPEAENDTTFTVSVSGGYAGNVLDNDTFGGSPATSNNVTITFNDPEQSGITVDERGDVYVPIGIGPGVYTLSYTICNADYPETCDTATVVITVEIEGIVVHNVISPNGDGINDHLTIEGIGSYPDNVLEIYNRWGLQVFKAEGYSNSGKVFDGTSDARMTMKKSNGMPAGTYYYVLRFRMDGEIQSKMGWLYIQNNN